MKNRAIKILSFLLAFCLFFGSTPSAIASADGLEQERARLQKSLDNIDRELKSLDEQSKQTRGYIDTLDRRLDILREQYSLAEQDIANDNARIKGIESDIFKNEQTLFDMEQDMPTLKAEKKDIEKRFDESYDEYCHRMRAMYISGGNLYNVFAFLLGCDSVSMMLTRLQMISSVAKRDSETLNDMLNKAKALDDSSKALVQKQSDISYAQVRLEEDKAQLKRERASLFQKEEDLSRQKATIEEDQAEANRLLKSLDDKTRQYGEYRDITSEELAEIDSAIAIADEKYRKDDSSNYNNTDKYIHLTYPCPTYTTITCGFGEYDGHSGCDFSTDGNENEEIVVAEDGTVILVKLLDYSYGHYLVIRHNKTTKKGNIVYTLYAHNNDILVQEGEEVKKGQLIAYSGTTGNSTGPHCHFEVRVGGSNQSDAKNPASYLK